LVPSHWWFWQEPLLFLQMPLCIIVTVVIVTITDASLVTLKIS
jgi:hypothetical protein